ncbi:MAG: adenylate kinase [Patescibacteria group bacterium]|nr:adenylate kinase [Patescibacteria group bacterium]MDD4304629.1 adenylate kinase [Patescibacteria group bacterium]MDD4695556.1 adenylate kinase [Patescibacteria group bacterium]
MNIVFLGMPGSGKGTQAEILSKKLNIPMCSTGNCFRKNIKDGTELGKKVEVIISRGELVPDKITFQMLKDEIQNTDFSNGIILDGYPRDLEQAEKLDEILKVDIAFNIEMSQEQVLLRIGGRRTCKCGATYHIEFNPPKKDGICDVCGEELFVRDDARPEIIKERIKVYKEQTEPLIEYYNNKGVLININGDPIISEVTKEIFEKLKL